MDNLATLEAPALETIGITHIAHSIKILHAKQFLEQTTASTTPGHRLRESFSGIFHLVLFSNNQLVTQQRNDLIP